MPRSDQPSADRPASEANAQVRVGTRELRQSLAQFARRAGQGERIVITIDGEPTAVLGPIEPSAAGVSLDDLAAAGLINPPGRTAAGSAKRSSDVPVPADSNVDRLIEQMRGR